jgi:hypothetical protein
MSPLVDPCARVEPWERDAQIWAYFETFDPTLPIRSAVAQISTGKGALGPTGSRRFIASEIAREISAASHQTTTTDTGDQKAAHSRAYALVLKGHDCKDVSGGSTPQLGPR